MEQRCSNCVGPMFSPTYLCQSERESFLTVVVARADARTEPALLWHGDGLRDDAEDIGTPPSDEAHRFIGRSGASGERKVAQPCTGANKRAQVSPRTLNGRPNAPTHSERPAAGMPTQILSHSAAQSAHAATRTRLRRVKDKNLKGHTQRCPLLERGDKFLWHPIRKPGIHSS